MSNSTHESWASRSSWPEHGLVPASARELDQERSQRPVGHGYNLAMEMTISVRGGERTEHSPATVAADVTYWATEFERVYLMSAARIRGKRKADTASRSGDACRLVIVLQIRGGNSVPQFIRTQLLSAGAAGSI